VTSTISDCLSQARRTNIYLWIYHVRHQGLYLWRDGRIERWQFVAIGAPAGHVRSGFGPGGPLADVVLMVFLDFEVDLAAATAFPSLSVLIFGFLCGTVYGCCGGGAIELGFGTVFFGRMDEGLGVLT